MRHWERLSQVSRRTFAWAQTSQAPYYKGVPSVRTTISCRLFAPLLALAAILTSVGAARRGRPVTEPSRPRPSPSPSWSVPLAGPPVAAPGCRRRSQVYVALQSGVVAAHRATMAPRSGAVEMRAEAPLAATTAGCSSHTGGAVYALRMPTARPPGTRPTATPAAPMLAQDGWLIVAAEDQLIGHPRRATARSSGASAIAGTSRAAERRGEQPLRPAGRWPRGRARSRDRQRASGNGAWAERPPKCSPSPTASSSGRPTSTSTAWMPSDGEVTWRQLVGAVVAAGRAADDGARVLPSRSTTCCARSIAGTARCAGHRRGVPFRPTAGPVAARRDASRWPGDRREILVFARRQRKPVGPAHAAAGARDAAGLLTEASGDHSAIAAVTGRPAIRRGRCRWPAGTAGRAAERVAPLTRCLPRRVRPASRLLFAHRRGQPRHAFVECRSCDRRENDSRMMLRPLPLTKNASPAT